jgi:hypothetical protein
VFDGIPDGRRTADPLGVAVEALGEALDPAHDQRDVAPEDAPVAVYLVDDDGFEAPEEPVPQAVGVGQDTVVEHIRRRQQDGWLALSDGFLLGFGLATGVLGDGDARGESESLRPLREGLGLVVDERDLRGDVEGGRPPVQRALEGRHGVRE